MKSLFDQGFDAFFEHASYKASTHPDWLNGYTSAERLSKGGHYNKQGRPNYSWNQEKYKLCA